MPIRIDLEHWPLVVHRSRGILEDVEVDAYVAHANALLARGEPHAVILDARGITEVPAYARAIKKAWLEDHWEALERHCVGTAILLDGSITRFVFATIALVQPFPTPFRVFGLEEEAAAWARGLLEARSRGATLPQAASARASSS